MQHPKAAETVNDDRRIGTLIPATAYDGYVLEVQLIINDEYRSGRACLPVVATNLAAWYVSLDHDPDTLGIVEQALDADQHRSERDDDILRKANSGCETN